MQHEKGVCWRRLATISRLGFGGGVFLCLRILGNCHNAFVRYVRPDIHLMAVQTRSEEGRPVPVIPASADADPGYHTGLSIIDMLDLIEELT